MRLLIDCFLLSFDFVVEELSASSSFCSNPDALGLDESEKGIFGSLKNITQLPPGSPKEGDRVADSAAGDTAGDQALREVGREPPAIDAGECLVCSTGFSVKLS